MKTAWLIVLLMFVSCEKHEITPNHQPVLKSSGTVGDIHNQSLDYILSNLTTGGDFNTLVTQAVKANEIFMASNQGCTSYSIEQAYCVWDFYSDDPTSWVMKELYASNIESRVELIEVMEIVLNEPLDYDEFCSKLSQIQLYTKYQEVYDLCDLCMKSCSYWIANYKRWESTINGPFKGAHVDPRFWDIMGADAEGFVGGLLGGGLVGGLIGGPVISGIRGITICLQTR